jgi:hypothetical protein
MVLVPTRADKMLAIRFEITNQGDRPERCPYRTYSEGGLKTMPTYDAFAFVTGPMRHLLWELNELTEYTNLLV